MALALQILVRVLRLSSADIVEFALVVVCYHE